MARLSDNAGMRVTVHGVRLYFDVGGCGLAAQGRDMVARPAIVLLHGGDIAVKTANRPI